MYHLLDRKIRCQYVERDHTAARPGETPAETTTSIVMWSMKCPRKTARGLLLALDHCVALVVVSLTPVRRNRRLVGHLDDSRRCISRVDLSHADSVSVAPPPEVRRRQNKAPSAIDQSNTPSTDNGPTRSAELPAVNLSKDTRANSTSDLALPKSIKGCLARSNGKCLAFTRAETPLAS